jgi:hypothetical protein
MANDVLSESPNMQHPLRLTPQQVFLGTNVNPNPKHWKPFACPVYVLDNKLQLGSGIFHKWKQRSRVGIYLGQSPQHAQSVALVLDHKTGLVSPQFHIKFNPSFQTVKTDEFDSQWQLKTGFFGPNKDALIPFAPKQSAPPEGALNTAPEGILKRKCTEPTINQNNNSEINRQLQRHTTIQAPELENPHNSEQKTHSSEQEGKDENPSIPAKIRQPVECLIEAMMAEVKSLTKGKIEGEIFCLEAMHLVRE